MKRLCMLAAAGAALVSFADVTPIQVSTKAELIEALGKYKTTAYEIQLAPGVYQFEDTDRMETEQYAGPSHLLISNVRLVGMGEVPGDVELCGSGMMRVIRANSPVVIANLKISGGHAKKVEGGSFTSDDCGGGVSGSCTLTNCVIANCRADNFGGGVRNYTALQDCTITDCSAAAGGGAYEPGVMRGCTVRNCTATGAGGGVYGRKEYPLLDCIIENNVSGGMGGGLIVASATNCIIRGNTANNAGGFGSWAGTPETSPELYNCQVYNNRTTGSGAYAGGVMGCRMIGGALYGNYATHGGGAAWADNKPMYLIGVDVHDNYATGNGGAGYGAVFSNCTITANMCGNDGNGGYGCKYYGCTLTKTDPHSALAIGSTFTDIGGNVTLDNQIYRDLNNGNDLTKKISAVCRGIPVCTNCLFVGNRMPNDYNSRLWVGVGDNKRGPQIVNCTIVSNQYAGIMNYVTKADPPAKIENCVFFGNRYHDGTTNYDLSGWEKDTTPASGLKLHNCAYGSAMGIFGASTFADYCDGPMYKYGADGFPADPGFNFGSTDEFEPKRKSPLRGLGVFDPEKVIEYDIRGAIDGGKYRRVRDGKVDLGCYQCWLPTPPTALYIR